MSEFLRSYPESEGDLTVQDAVVIGLFRSSEIIVVDLKSERDREPYSCVEVFEMREVISDDEITRIYRGGELSETLMRSIGHLVANKLSAVRPDLPSLTFLFFPLRGSFEHFARTSEWAEIEELVRERFGFGDLTGAVNGKLRENYLSRVKKIVLGDPGSVVTLWEKARN